MAVIFWLSSRNSDESALQSNWILQCLISIFGDNFLTDFIVRKAAHFLEYTGLSLFFNISLFQTGKRKSIPLAVLFTSLYAITDEIHQYFIPGRACRFTDWMIDTAGALFGALIFIVILKIVFTVFAKRKNIIDSKNN